jgi:hypothetical protein
MTFSIQRLRTLTTGKLHTEIDDVKEDLGRIFDRPDSVTTHMIPNLLDAALPWLQSIGLPERFFDGTADASHVGDITIPEPTDADRAAMWQRYRALPSPFASRIR